MKSRSSFISKLDTPKEPKFVELNHKLASKWGQGTMVIPQTRVIQNFIRQIPKGNLLTIPMLRQHIANYYKVDIACPLTTGIFLNIIAHATEEAIQNNIPEEQVPYWRVLQKDGSINAKLPGGLEHQAILLENEGFEIIRKSPTKYLVQGWQQYLFTGQFI